jgi:hypothetical protein
MKEKAEISRSLIKEILDELISNRENCADYGFGQAVDRIQSIITKLCDELSEDV